MTTRNPLAALPTTVHGEAPVKAPPVLVRGPVAWMRKNLFATPFDTILTLIAGLIVVAVTVSFLGWSIGQANWLVITRNFRLFMAGTFPLEAIWRVNLVALMSAFGVGFSAYAFMRPPRWLPWAMLAFVALLLIFPPLVYAVTDPAPSLLAAGQSAIASGTATETPIPQVGFIGRAGETITVEYLPAADDAELASSAGFSDRASLALVNAARNRLNAVARQTELERQLAGDLLTANQRAAAEEELARLTIAPSPVETYAVNQSPVQVRLINPDTQVVLVEAELGDDGRFFIATLPYDGWFLLEKTVTDQASIALLRATRIEPLVERGLSGRTVYTRVLDDFTVEQARPLIEGDEITFAALTDNQWQGLRSFPQYLRIFAAPLTDVLARGLIPLLGAGVLGFVVAKGLGRVLPRPKREAGNPRWPARRLLLWLWIVLLGVSWFLLLGLPGARPAEVSSIAARLAWVAWMFFAGLALNRAWGRPLFGLLVVLALGQTLLEGGVLTGRTTISWASLPGLVVNFALWLLVGWFVARRGVSSRGLFRPKQVLIGLVVCGLLWLGLLVALPALAEAGGVPAVPLPGVDTRRWGGLLLTAVITVVALVASFPLGILLALGRRSSLPLVRGVCTAFIELVRGVPLITVLFMAMLLVPLLNPSLASVENVFRAIVGFTLFSAAYLAENVRGGLQSVPFGQEEAARALGLSGWQVILLITLPQALRAVIPALVGQCIALFKDTSLVALVGLTDLTGMSKAVIAQAEFVGFQAEVYVFISVIYFIFSYAMAYVSRRIEASGSGKARRL